MALRSVAVAQLSGTSMRGTPPKSLKAFACPRCQDSCLMSRNPSAQNLPEKGRTTTSSQALALEPVTRSVTQAGSPAQST